MKKVFLTVMSLAIAASSAILFPQNVSTEKAQAIGNESSFAEYVSVENAPKIDGEIDEIWNSAESYIVTGTSPNSYTYATIEIFWNETGLYFLAEVFDSTVNEDDRCNLWVSETYYDIESDKVYPEVNGAYYLCLNPSGKNLYYCPDNFEGVYDDMAGNYTVGTKETETGYTVEVYVELTGGQEFRFGQSIGFDVSIDDYLAKGEKRDSYVNWNGIGWYWEKPSCLGEVMLFDFNEENGSPVKAETGNTNDSSSSSSSSSSSNSSSNTSSELSNDSTESSGCASMVWSLPIATIALCAGVIVMKKKWN